MRIIRDDLKVCTLYRFCRGSAFGEDSLVQSKIGRFLTASRFSRAVYGGAKIFAFMTVIACHVPEFTPPTWLVILMNVSVYLTVIFCVLRASVKSFIGQKPFHTGLKKKSF